jgi:hypothetical protein
MGQTLDYVFQVMMPTATGAVRRRIVRGARVNCPTNQTKGNRRMSKLDQSLQLFQDSVASAMVHSPDKYQAWHPGWPFHRDDLLQLWADVKPRLKRDLHKVALIDEKLAAACESFDRDQREPDRSLMFEIYNVLNLNTLW